jgi:hypothetical protein
VTSIHDVWMHGTHMTSRLSVVFNGGNGHAQLHMHAGRLSVGVESMLIIITPLAPYFCKLGPNFNLVTAITVSSFLDNPWIISNWCNSDIYSTQ